MAHGDRGSAQLGTILLWLLRPSPMCWFGMPNVMAGLDDLDDGARQLANLELSAAREEPSS